MAKRITIKKTNITALITELGVQRTTLEERAAKLNIDLTAACKHGDLTLRDLVLLATGDRNAVRQERDRLEVEKLKRDARKEAGELVDVKLAIETFNTETLAPFKAALIDLARKKGFESELRKIMEGFLK